MTKPSSGKSGAKTGGKAVRKIREFATSELFDVGTDMVAFMASHFAIDFIRKVPDVFKNAFGKLGKAAGEKFEAGDLSKVVNHFKSGLAEERMPESYRLDLEELIEEELREVSIILGDGEISASERIAALSKLKRDTQDKIKRLEERYREQPYDIRIMERLTPEQQKKIRSIKWSSDQLSQWQVLREQIKSATVFGLILDDNPDAERLLKELQSLIGTPPKPDPQQVLSAKINEGGRMLKQGLMAVDTFVKDLLPYEEVRLPNMKRKELWAEYWNRVISAPDVQSLKQSGEGDPELKKRLMADKKFVAVMERKLQERNRRIN